VPSDGIDQTTLGSTLKATTTIRSGFRVFNSSIKLGSLRFVGWNIFNLFSSASFLTAEEVIFFPRPEGLSGAVTTATNSN